MLRRSNPSILSHVLKVGDLVLDRQQHRVYRKEKEVRLGRRNSGCSNIS
jgi:two-component system phosphate regulon response regulator PhoB